MIFSGTFFETTALIKNAAGALIAPGTRAMVIAVKRETEPAIYLCEACDPLFEPEEFYCFADQMRLVERVG